MRMMLPIRQPLPHGRGSDYDAPGSDYDAPSSDYDASGSDYGAPDSDRSRDREGAIATPPEAAA